MSLKFTVAILTDKRDEVIALLMPFNGGGNWNFMTQSLFVQWCCSAIVDLGTSFNEMLILMLTLNHWSELQSRGSAYYPLAAVLCTLSSAPSCKVLVPFPTFDPCSSPYQDTIIWPPSSLLAPASALPWGHQNSQAWTQTDSWRWNPKD